MKDKCCGNCKHFGNECADGWGSCKFHLVTKRDDKCGYHSFANNGWAEITTENVEEVRKTDVGRLMIAVITHGEPYYMEYREMFSELTDMAKYGGYYYYVLPELKIE